MTHNEIERRFTFVPPNMVRKEKHEDVGRLTKELAHKLNLILPEGREKSLAMTDLEAVRMRANQAIATCTE
jgi:hypothetical protein